MKLLAALLCSILLSLHAASAITADELAQFLGIHSWSTKVTLPPNSFSAEIMEIKDGAVVDRLLMPTAEEAHGPGDRLRIMLGPVERGERAGNYKLSILVGLRGILGMESKIPLFKSTLSNPLPETIGEGDFIFFGETRKPFVSAGDLGSYATGFLLRIRKLPPAADEKRKHLRCLANAKQIALACKLYAMDHDGNYPTKREEIVPDYIVEKFGVFRCPLDPAQSEMGYELLGGKESDAPSKVIVRGRFTTGDGRRSVVYLNQWGALEWQ